MKLKRKIVLFCISSLVFLSSFFLAGCLEIFQAEKRVPVYEKMTVSGVVTSGGKKAASVAHLSTNKDFLPSAPNDEKHPHDGNCKDKWDEVDKEKPFGNGNDVQNAVGSLVVEGGASALYYATPNQDVYITVHISNPANYEILSFVLNGKKYSNYMFEYGSDLENLILKVNVGDVAGFLEYTIDAIKYVDGTKIKDVLMDGEKTVRIGVYSDDLVSINVANETIGYTDFALDVAVSDEYGLMADGVVKAIIYDGEQVVYEQNLATLQGENVHVFNLRPDNIYQCAIVAYYDALDGTGFEAHILHKQAFITKTVVQFSDIEIAKDSVSFAWYWDEAWENKNLTGVELWCGDILTATYPQETTLIEGLAADTEYTIIAKYLLGNKEEQAYLTFTTDKELPLVCESKGLEIVNGVIVGIGACTDSVLYLNHSVADEAFSYNETITKVVFLEGATSLGAHCFGRCYQLKEAVFTTVTPPQIDSDIFGGTWDSEDFRIYVPKESLSAYMAVTAEFWQDLALDNIYGIDLEDFIGGDDENFPDNKEDIELPEDKEDIELPGDVDFGEMQESKGLKIENGVITGIGDCKDSVLYLNHPVAEFAFSNCQTIKKVVFLEGVTWLGEKAFETCQQLKTVVFTTVIPPQIGSDLFCITWDAEDFRIYVPQEGLSAYMAITAAFWQEYAIDNIICFFGKIES